MSDIENIKRKLLIKYPVFASIILNTEYKETNEVKTSATDGMTIFYNKNYLENISLDEQVFLLAHEVCHIAFRHIPRANGKKIKLWNIATDAVINQFLKEDGLSLLPNVINIPEAIQYSAEEFYEKLLQDRQDGQNSLIGHDSHEMWKDSAKEIFPKNNQNKSISEKNIFQKNKEYKQEQIEKLKQELNQEEIEMSTSKNIRTVSEIETSKMQINWRYFLRDSMKKDWDWSYQNATIEDGIVTPTLQEISFPLSEVLIDTSRSIDQDLLKAFLSECKKMLNYTQLKIGCFDKKFYGFQKIRNSQELDQIILEGGGGTDFDIAVASFSKRVENKIIFTDGKAPMPKEVMNILWIVLGEEKIYPKGGKVIYMNREELLEQSKIKRKIK